MKKLFSMLITMAILLSMTPSQSAYAAVKISKAKATLEVDATLTLKITGTEDKVKWTSSKEAIATVNSKGTVTAVKSGTATVIATVSNKNYSCSVYVVNSKNVSVTVGEVAEFTSGEYIVGEDIPAGTYTLTITDGYGSFYAYATESEFDKDGINYKRVWLDASKESDTTYKNFKLKKGNYLVISNGMLLNLNRTK